MGYDGTVRALWAILTLAVGAAASGEDQIARIRARVAETTARIPNYTCLETIERRWYTDEFAEDRVADRVRIEVAVVDGKEQFSWPGGIPLDARELEEILRRGVSKSGDFSGFLSGVFVSNFATYTLVGEQAGAIRRSVRYDYRVPAQAGYLLNRDAAQAVVAYHGSFWVDPETLDLMRLEIEGDDITPKLKMSSAKLAIDYERVAVGAGTFLLPRATDVRMAGTSGLEDRAVARFTGCRQFLAESSLSFDDRPVAPAPIDNDPGAELPAGLNLDVVLAAPIVRKTAAVGDVVQAELRKEVKTKGGVMVPKGAVVDGRIVTLETHGSAQSADLLGLRFTRIRFGAKQVRLRAAVVKCGAGYRAVAGLQPWAEDGLLVSQGGFLALPKGLGLTLQTEAVPSH